MSTLVAVGEKVSKKRKHESNTKELKRKKHKADDSSTANTHIVEDATSKAKRRKRREGSENGEENQIDTTNNATSLQTNNSVEHPSIGKAEKSRPTKKRRKDVEEEESNSEAQYEGGTLIAASQPDEIGPNLQDRGNEDDAIMEDHMLEDTNNSRLLTDTKTCFHSIRMSLYLPVPAIAFASQLSALLTVHLSPLLLTFFPPAGGVILSYHDPVISARPEPGPSRPLAPPTDGNISIVDGVTLSKVGEEFGASWVWLTVTFLVFKPKPGDEVEGWTNVMSEGFIGLVSYNYFQTSISRNRIPKSWTWNGPSRRDIKQRRQFRKGKLNDSDEPSQETMLDSQDTLIGREDDAIDGAAGYFVDENEEQIPEDLKFKVADLEMIQAQERGRIFALQLEGTLLDVEEEQRVQEEERVKWEVRANKNKSRLKSPGTPLMSGGLPTHSRAGSVMSTQ